nr:Co2+/Mg2+ efflux protein ApaG [Marinicella sp. W31]MDC2878354.1 Co2+/Mg2+ efflux protein ApaG [Marinicella sp. W31]
MDSETTDDIEIKVETRFLDEHSSPADDQFVWAYDIEIVNHGAIEVQIIARHWTITNADGIVETVNGPGVAGKQPVLESGGRFAYQSAAPLDTPSGIMVGHYVLRTGDNRLLRVVIPPFSLDSPYEDRSHH